MRNIKFDVKRDLALKMAAAGLLLPTLAASSNGIGRGNRMRNSVNIDIHRRSRDQSSISPPSPLLSNLTYTKRENNKGKPVE